MVDKKQPSRFFNSRDNFEIENRKWEKWQSKHYLGIKKLTGKKPGEV
jgi:hypothetical protein